MGRDKILLIGMPGCGKSTVGGLLSKELNYNFCDMDKYIEEISGERIPQLFEKGESFFRDWETKACEILSKKKRVVISSGGGVIKREENIENFRNNSIIIYIDRPVSNIIEDIDTERRPLLAEGKEKVYELYQERNKLYNKYCDIKVLNEGFVKDVVLDIKGKVIRRLN